MAAIPSPPIVAMNLLTSAPPAPAPATASRGLYRATLAWLFTLFNSVRVLAYLPTAWAIHGSGDASQHSLWTWLIWTGANATMAAWLYEQNDQRVNRAMLVSLCNATMCLAITVLIVSYRP